MANWRVTFPLDKAFFKAKTHEGCSHPLHGLYSLYSLYNHGLFTKGCLYSLYMLFFDFICSPSIFMKYPRCFHFSRAMSKTHPIFGQPVGPR